MKSLYVTDRRAAGDDRLFALLESLRGAPALSVQLREKDIADRDYLTQARRARQALGAGIPLYVNRRFDIALEAQADGVHLPAAGLPPRRVRTATPRGFRLGVSTHSAAEAARAIEEGVDLLCFGPIFVSPSKEAYGRPLGPEALSGFPPVAGHPTEVFAIGGISEENLALLEPFRDRFTGIAAIRLFQEAKDPRGVVDRIAAQ